MIKRNIWKKAYMYVTVYNVMHYITLNNIRFLLIKNNIASFSAKLLLLEPSKLFVTHMIMIFLNYIWKL